jgi:hypothetical protein
MENRRNEESVHSVGNHPSTSEPLILSTVVNDFEIHHDFVAVSPANKPVNTIPRVRDNQSSHSISGSDHHDGRWHAPSPGSYSGSSGYYHVPTGYHSPFYMHAPFPYGSAAPFQPPPQAAYMPNGQPWPMNQHGFVPQFATGYPQFALPTHPMYASQNNGYHRRHTFSPEAPIFTPSFRDEKLLVNNDDRQHDSAADLVTSNRTEVPTRIHAESQHQSSSLDEPTFADHTQSVPEGIQFNPAHEQFYIPDNMVDQPNFVKGRVNMTKTTIAGVLQRVKNAKPIMGVKDVRQDLMNKLVTDITESAKIMSMDISGLLSANADCFYRPGDKLSSTWVAEHAIPLHDENKAVFIRSKALGHAETRVILDLTQKAIHQGIIEHCQVSSAFNCPHTSVPKKQLGKWRLIGQFVHLNKASTRIPLYPMARIDDALHLCRGMNVFSTSDFTSGYFQVKIRSADRHKTAFRIHNHGQYQYIEWHKD